MQSKISDKRFWRFTFAFAVLVIITGVLIISRGQSSTVSSNGMQFNIPRGWQVDDLSTAYIETDSSIPLDYILKNNSRVISVRIMNPKSLPQSNNDYRRPYLYAERIAAYINKPVVQWYSANSSYTILEVEQKRNGLGRYILSGKAGSIEIQAVVGDNKDQKTESIRECLAGILSSIKLADRTRPFKDLNLNKIKLSPIKTCELNPNNYVADNYIINMPKDYRPEDIVLPGVWESFETGSKNLITLLPRDPNSEAPALNVYWLTRRQREFIDFEKRFMYYLNSSGSYEVSRLNNLFDANVTAFRTTKKDFKGGTSKATWAAMKNDTIVWIECIVDEKMLAGVNTNAVSIISQFIKQTRMSNNAK